MPTWWVLVALTLVATPTFADELHFYGATGDFPSPPHSGQPPLYGTPETCQSRSSAYLMGFENMLVLAPKPIAPECDFAYIIRDTRGDVRFAHHAQCTLDSPDLQLVFLERCE